MKFTVLTLFPELIQTCLSHGVVGRASEQGVFTVETIALRDYGTGRHRQVDDHPFGGGAGMIMTAPVLVRALEDLTARDPGVFRILLTPSGKPFTQPVSRSLAERPHVAFLCGRYEGVDARVEAFVDERLSLGDFVLSGGELAALAMIDSIARLLPGTLGNASSAGDESFSTGLLEYPQYTRPAGFRGMEVPEVLRSGDHGAIQRWRRKEALRRTRRDRPALLEQVQLTRLDKELLKELENEP
ncbi:MAG: tRNA (guanine-N(1)-)-methyltransferase [Myxococcota bacterium]|nr:tRNA (guanine-N(1)-)-methyltransferase [Myxococcota bacterium]